MNQVHGHIILQEKGMCMDQDTLVFVLESWGGGGGIIYFRNDCADVVAIWAGAPQRPL